jgi:hypothetical protein
MIINVNDFEYRIAIPEGHIPYIDETIVYEVDTDFIVEDLIAFFYLDNKFCIAEKVDNCWWLIVGG